MGTSANRSSANPNYYTRGDVIPGIWVDGMDILAVKSATKFAIDFVLNCTPIILEMYTYRYFGHSMSDPGVSYRTRDEIESIRKQRDPIASFREVILSNNLATEEELKTIDSKVKEEIDKATEIAKTDKEIPLEELCADVYYQPLEPKTRGTLVPNWESKIVQKRSEKPPIPPKEKPKFEGFAFTIGQKPVEKTGEKDEKGEEEKDQKDKKEGKKEEKKEEKQEKKGEKENKEGGKEGKGGEKGRKEAEKEKKKGEQGKTDEKGKQK